MTHRDAFLCLSARSRRRGDVAHRKSRATQSERPQISAGSVASRGPSESVEKLCRCAASPAALLLPEGPQETIPMGHYQLLLGIICVPPCVPLSERERHDAVGPGPAQGISLEIGIRAAGADVDGQGKGAEVGPERAS